MQLQELTSALAASVHVTAAPTAALITVLLRLPRVELGTAPDGPAQAFGDSPRPIPAEY